MKNISKFFILILIMFAFASCKHQGMVNQKKYKYLQKVPVNSERVELTKPEKIKNTTPPATEMSAQTLTVQATTETEPVNPLQVKEQTVKNSPSINNDKPITKEKIKENLKNILPTGNLTAAKKVTKIASARNIIKKLKNPENIDPMEALIWILIILAALLILHLLGIGLLELILAALLILLILILIKYV